MQKEGKKYLIMGVDIGGSSNKIYTKYDGASEFNEYPNTVIKHDGYIRIEDYINDDSKYQEKLDLTINIEAQPKSKYKEESSKIIEEINSNRWILGALSEAVSPSPEKLSYSTSKMKQKEYFLNIISALAIKMNKHDLSHWEVAIGCLLPPQNYFELEKEIIEDILVGRIHIRNNVTKESVEVKIRKDNLIVKPEAVVAFNSAFFSEGELTSLGKKYVDKFNIAIDIGQHTTDFAGIKEGKPLPVTFHTFKFAGGLLLQYLSKQIFRKYGGYIPTDKEIKRAYASGKLVLGNNAVDIQPEIEMANKEFAQKLFNEFNQYYLLNKDIHLQQIASFMFLGGGSIKTGEIKSVPEFFMDLVHETSEHTIHYSPDYIRFANINGLAEILKNRY